MVDSDGHAALNAVLTEVTWQQCHFHLMRNAMPHAPEIARRPASAGGVRRVFDTDEPTEAERRPRTTNGLERLHTEINHRTRVAALLPNEASLLRLASAVLSENSDDRATERAYLNMETR